MRRFFAWTHRYERHLSAAAMVVGFIFDNLFFHRIDEASTHIVFISYLVIAALTIAVLHYLEEHSIEGVARPKWRSILPISTQFALGGLWSGFLIFFSRSAAFATSWPFLLLLGAIFLGNEIFKKYHDRLVFNAVLYFFALYAYFIFSVPLVTHSIGTGTFILSGVATVLVFALFMMLLRSLGRFRVMKSIWQIRFWAGTVFLIMNIFYFTNILPPLPLALADGGVYYRITKTASGYVAEGEESKWPLALGLPAQIHLPLGSPLYAYSAVFAPIALSTTISHEWQLYSEATGEWHTSTTLSFPISGGRAAGYRGYTILQNPVAGAWRVNIKTPDGRLVGRLRFDIIAGAKGQPSVIQL